MPFYESGSTVMVTLLTATILARRSPLVQQTFGGRGARVVL